MQRHRILWLLAAVGSASSWSVHPYQDGTKAAPGAPTLDETRLTLNKWFETQQILSKERSEWQQGKEILAGRLELVKKEIAATREAIEKAQASANEAGAKRAELQAQRDQLEASRVQLADSVVGMESAIRALYPRLPEPVAAKIQPLYQRIPEDGAATRVTVAERYQNVLVVLNELNAANNDVSVNYEVHTLAGGKPAEVRTLYVGLAQAYYISGQGEAGIGRPGTDGWTWEPAQPIADAVSTAVEILQGKHSPAFVPLPVRVQ